MAVPDEAAVGNGRPVETKKSAWTKEEDAVLREQVRLHGAQNWAAISEALAGRNPKSCSLRWYQHLIPIANFTMPFTPEEDEKIIAFYRMYPSNWAPIPGFLPGHTADAIKNRWHSVLSTVYQKRQRAAARIRRLPDGTLVLFPLTPGDVKASGMDTIPVLLHPPPGVDLSGECLNLFPLVPGDIVRGNNASEAAAMDMDCSTDESLVELSLWPSTNHEVGVQVDESLTELRLWPSTNHGGGVQGDGAGSSGSLGCLESA